jgi:membrane protein YdbS with pleckstrin-like domain
MTVLSILDDFLEPSEWVIWRGKPSKMAYLWWDFGPISVALFFFLFVFVAYVFGGSSIFDLRLMPFLAIGIGFLIIPIIWRLRKYKHVEYVITDQKLIIKSGKEDDDVWVINLDNIKQIIVKKGVIGKIFGTAKIYPIIPSYPYNPEEKRPWFKVKSDRYNAMHTHLQVYNIVESRYDMIEEYTLRRMVQSHPRLEALNNYQMVEQLLKERINRI